MFKKNSFVRAMMLNREEIINLDFRRIDKFIKLAEEEFSHDTQNSLDFFVGGYDNKEKELYEIMEVRKYFRELLKRHPYLFYYLHKDSWQLVYLCTCANIANTSQKSSVYTEVQFRRDVEFIKSIMQSTIDYKADDMDELEDSMMELLEFMKTGASMQG